MKGTNTYMLVILMGELEWRLGRCVFCSDEIRTGRRLEAGARQNGGGEAFAFAHSPLFSFLSTWKCSNERRVLFTTKMSTP